MDFHNLSAVKIFFLVISFNLSLIFCCITPMKIRTPKTLPEGYKARIIGGTVVSSIKDYAYNVYIFTRTEDGDGEGISCGGAIIGVKWILTAGHCLPSDTSVMNVKVSVGSKQSTNGKRYEVKRAIKHYNYQDVLDQSTGESNYLYDYMILKLSTNLKYSKEVQKIDIGSNADIVTGRMAILTGYGRTSKESGAGTTPNYLLHRGEFIMSSYLDCHGIVPFLDIYEFCARKEGAHAFEGDSGSPLVIKTRKGSKLIGVMSQAANATDGQRSDVYCSVPYVRTWIRNTIGA